MNARMQQIWAGLVGFFGAQPPARRVAILATAVGSGALVLGIAWWVQQPIYRPLFTNLSPEDAASIVEALKAQKGSYQIQDGGAGGVGAAERRDRARPRTAGKR